METDGNQGVHRSVSTAMGMKKMGNRDVHDIFDLYCNVAQRLTPLLTVSSSHIHK